MNRIFVLFAKLREGVGPEGVLQIQPSQATSAHSPTQKQSWLFANSPGPSVGIMVLNSSTRPKTKQDSLHKAGDANTNAGKKLFPGALDPSELPSVGRGQGHVAPRKLRSYWLGLRAVGARVQLASLRLGVASFGFGSALCAAGFGLCSAGLGAGWSFALRSLLNLQRRDAL